MLKRKSFLVAIILIGIFIVGCSSNISTDKNEEEVEGLKVAITLPDLLFPEIEPSTIEENLKVDKVEVNLYEGEGTNGESIDNRVIEEIDQEMKIAFGELSSGKVYTVEVNLLGKIEGVEETRTLYKGVGSSDPIVAGAVATIDVWVNSLPAKSLELNIRGEGITGVTLNHPGTNQKISEDYIIGENILFQNGYRGIELHASRWILTIEGVGYEREILLLPTQEKRIDYGDIDEDGEIDGEIIIPKSPEAPENLSLNENSSLVWDEVEGATVYAIYRTSQDSLDGISYLDTVSTNLYSDVEDGYYYWVRAYSNNLSGEISQSYLVKLDDDVLYLAQDFYYDMDDENVNRATSKRFQLIWGTDDSRIDQFFIEGNLKNLEGQWDIIVDQLNFKEPSQSVMPEKRDGNKYKVNIYITETGLEHHKEGFAFMGFAGGAGFGYIITNPDAMRVDPPSWVLPHEFGHVVTVHQAEGDLKGGWNNNAIMGPWWESVANWKREMYLYSDKYQFDGKKYGPDTGFPVGHYENAHLFQAHGRSYYDSWFIMNYLHENPEGFNYYGDDFMAKVMQESNRSQNFFDMIDELAPGVSLKDTLGHSAKRMATQDYEQRDIYRDKFEGMIRNKVSYYRTFTELKRVSDKPDWWRVPIEYAPQQTGLNIIKLEGESNSVSVEFNGLVDEERGSDWRVAIVAKDNSGNTSYSRLFNSGKASLSVSPSDELFLVVTATPDDIMDANAFAGEDNMPYESHPAKARFPYEVRIEGARPYESKPDIGNLQGSPHSNGGGFVASSASVDPSAYVGPNAAVLGVAKVLDNARIEDYAVVNHEAVVSGNAVVSGYAMIKNRSKVKDFARVRDYGILRGNSEVRGNGRVLESAILDTNTVIQGFGVAKGSAYAFGDGLVEGYGVIDGDYAGALQVSGGTVFGWLSPQNYADSRDYEDALYLAYYFDQSSTIYAIDRYGVNHGILRGSPSTNGSLNLNGSSQYVVLEDHLLDYKQRAIEVDFKWDGGANNQRIWSLGSSEESQMYLTPQNDDGRVQFVIEKDGNKETLTGNSSITVGERTKVRVEIREGNSTLYINDQEVASANITIAPEDLRGPNINTVANQNYIGRGSRDFDPYFAGEINSFKVYNIE